MEMIIQGLYKTQYNIVAAIKEIANTKNNNITKDQKLNTLVEFLDSDSFQSSNEEASKYVRSKSDSSKSNIQEDEIIYIKKIQKQFQK